MKRLAFAIAAMFAFVGVAEAQVRVRGYTRSDGTYVAPHYRSSPNSTTYDNYSTRGNVNPFTGAIGMKAPDQSAQYSSPYQTYNGPPIIVPGPPVQSVAPPVAYAAPVDVPETDPATFQTGADIYANCGPLAAPSDLTQCYGYIAGVHDAMVNVAEQGFIKKPFCFPESITVGEIATYSALTVPYDQERMQQNSFWVLIDIWSIGYPCPMGEPT